ncbi:MAG: hypothetical protein ACI9HJ_001122, partial [Ulvibacter sp.]
GRIQIHRKPEQTMVRINYKTARQTTKPFLTGPLAMTRKKNKTLLLLAENSIK